MYVKVTKSGPRKYLQLVEAYRDENGRPKQCTIATLGRLDKLGDELESVVEGLCRITGRSLPDKPAVSFESSRALGDVWALTQLWNALGFEQLRKAFLGTRHSIQIEALISIMVMNRLTSPDVQAGRAALAGDCLYSRRAYFGPFRTVISGLSEHPFRFNPNAHSAIIRTLLS
ncbi:hypothetical protein Ga0061065_1217 [Marinomonas fungiae]|uniref:Uncharacterized protein n=1 Tax=Marinomonas fungiae TaxID=1137284 RepID=A0A0K6IUE1_9GAMM|nr:hypothetical protein Ga0061065_1217 [Marinomonas fungiae]